MFPAKAAVALAAALLSQRLLLSVAAGCCPNGCSGHGSCNNSPTTPSFSCTCYTNWQSSEVVTEDGDCSARTCPYELAWADAPSATGKHHLYAECANKGVCNRSTGECECFPGYEGKACGRMSCPQGKAGVDCSGHGRCLFANDVAYGRTIGDYIADNSITTPAAGGSLIGTSNGNDAQTFSYYNWDNDKTRVCVCDPGYEGTDCSKRSCPWGTDVMATETDQVQIINLLPATTTPPSTLSGDFALTYTSKTGQRFTTESITLGAAITTASEVAAQLEALPGGIIDEVVVSGTVTAATEYTFRVTFTGNNVKGAQELLEVEWRKCTTGCTPYSAGISPTVLGFSAIGTNTAFSSVTATGFTATYVCGNRGRCDYDKGICECFDGYYGGSCNKQTALI